LGDPPARILVFNLIWGGLVHTLLDRPPRPPGALLSRLRPTPLHVRRCCSKFGGPCCAFRWTRPFSSFGPHPPSLVCPFRVGRPLHVPAVAKRLPDGRPRMPSPGQRMAAAVPTGADAQTRLLGHRPPAYARTQKRNKEEAVGDPHPDSEQPSGTWARAWDAHIL